jgi:diguanylate cyclase (GGDEF)-like protein
MKYEDLEIKERLQWLVKLRWAGCIGVLVATHIVREIEGLTFPLIPVYIILGSVALYNAYFQQKLKLPETDLLKNAIWQISFDFLAITVAVFFSGGGDSPFLYYYVFHIVISGIILPMIWTFRFAVIAIALPSAVIGLQQIGLLPYVSIFERPRPVVNLSVMVAYGGVFASTLLLTAYFVTYLSDKLYKKQDEIRRHYILSEKLRSSIIMNDVIGTIKEELSGMTMSPQIVYMPMDKSKLSLIYSSDGENISIPVADRNIFTDTLLSCDAHILESTVVRSGYEDKVFKDIMKGAKKIVVLPVHGAFTAKCYEMFHCPEGSECPAFNADERRCWYISGTHCHGKIMRTVMEKLKECVDCDMFAPVGIFIMDATRKSKLESEIDIDACMRLLDSASLAVSNAKLYEKTLEMSETDSLTGLRNRRIFFRTFDTEVTRAHRYSKQFGLIMLDIDHFKKYNDTNGHPQGDILLKMVSDSINENIRETDTLGRYGGEEFIALLPETMKDETAEIAERIRSAIETTRFPRAESQPGGKITVSIGVASYPEDGDSADKIVKSADDALYGAKNAGRNKVVVSKRT